MGIGSIYISNQVNTIYGGDAGDLVSAIVTRGIAHPPGYPLYTLLGIILNKFILVGTSAWRVGFLSSIPGVLAIFVLFDLLFYLTSNFLISAISVFVLAFTYPFWLYSEVVEVFSLNNLFIVLLLWNFFHFLREKKVKYLYTGSFILGLSFTHHHIIIFLLPALLYLVLQKRKLLKRKQIFSSLTFLSLGLVPYLYVFVSAIKQPVINWMGQPTFSSFMQLVTRSTYGTFKAGSFIAHQPALRFLDIYGFWDFALKDFRLTGVLLFIAGFIYLLKFERQNFFALSVGFLSYLFFLFYASFPLSDNFIVGTFERFVLPLYILATFFITFGLLCFIKVIDKILDNFLDKKKKEFVLGLILIMFVTYPLGIFSLNFPKISILKKDLTAENFGSDLLSSVPKSSIILIGVDTPLFDSQYVYYTDKKWSDIKLIHFNKLINPETSWQIAQIYPDLIYPSKDLAPKEKLEFFLAENYKKFPIFSKQPYVSNNGDWVPWGLLFRYFKKEDLPKDTFINSENKRVWSIYHDPLSGSLSKYQNLLLSDILRMYSIAHQEIGFWEAKNGYSEDAQMHLIAAEKLTPQDLDSYNILAQVYIQQNKCDEAKEQIDYRISKDGNDPSIYLLMSINYAVCYKDPAKASFYQNLYVEKQKKKETPLKKV